jgi:sphingolipid delta-4 desaturase
MATPDFHWVGTDEPHATRRGEILKAHPEIARLMVPEPKTLWIVLAIFCVQFSAAYLLRDATWWLILVVAYVLGGTLNHTLQLASHELSHNLCFPSTKSFFNYNELLAIFTNLSTGIPSALQFKRYHLDHHKFQGVDGIDTDVPTSIEVKTFTNAPLKALWVLLNPAFYAIRPLLVKPKPLKMLELVNIAVVLFSDYLVLSYFGPKALAYLLLGTILGLGLHPVAGHFIAEHYEFTRGYETYSYYGPLNYVNFNVGYHWEHHDFPNIPWSRLPEVRKLAPEFYNDLPYYTSYLAVIWKYITDPSVGPHSRIKRLPAQQRPALDSKSQPQL